MTNITKLKKIIKNNIVFNFILRLYNDFEFAKINEKYENFLNI